MNEVKRFKSPLGVDQFKKFISSGELPDSEPIMECDLTVIHDAINDTMTKKNKSGKVLTPPQWDRYLVEPTHKTLSSLPIPILTSMGLWHWLCLFELKEFVLNRWVGPNHTEENMLKHGNRFIGNQTLNGASRNCLARLFRIGDLLYSDADGYSLCEQAFRNQTLIQGLLDCDISLNRVTSRATVKAISALPEGQIKKLLPMINTYLSSMKFVILTEDEIASLIIKDLIPLSK